MNMKNITDYFSNSEKESPNRENIKERKSKESSNIYVAKTDMSHVSNRKKKTELINNSVKHDSFMGENKKMLQGCNSSSVKKVLQDETKSSANYNSSTSSDENIDEQTSRQIKSDKKNAFQIMMESRNKSIGTNSPGKELDSNDILNKDDRTKTLSIRKKIFSEWAELKGGAKRKREEEERKEIIKIKLEKRSKRMKKLLIGNIDLSDSSNDSVDIKISSRKRKKKLRKLSCSSNSSIEPSEDFEKQKIGILNSKKGQSSVGEQSISKNQHHKRISKNKIELKENIFNGANVDENNKDLINVPNVSFKDSIIKLTGNLKAQEKIPLSIKDKEMSNIILDESSQESLNTPPALRSWRMRIKLNLNENDIKTAVQNLKEQKQNNVNTDEDTKDSVTLISSSSDEEHIPNFNKPKKVAPVFLQAAPKPKLDPEVLRARQEFLMSGTPSILKLKCQKQKSITEKPFDVFPSISHIQQKCENLFWNLPKQNISLSEYSPYKYNHMTCKNLINKSETSKNITLENLDKFSDIRTVLNEIKSNNPDYPVFKSFRLIHEKSGKNLLQAKQEDIPTIKKKRGRPKKTQSIKIKSLEKQDKEVDLVSYAMWTEKYKPKSAEDIIGNGEAVRKLKTWLESWKSFSQAIISKKSRRNSSSSEFETTDGDSRDSTRLPDNTITLGGPCGSGKSTAVYAICNQLGFNVIEINASSKRTGRKLLQDLQEATQSYQVRKAEKGIDNLFNSNKAKEKIQSQESKADDKMCVLLVEDVDIVFDQDDGFILALQQLIMTSKRPIILTTTDYSSNFSQRFLFDYECISFSPLESSSLATWCQIVCLIEGKYVSRDDIASLIDYNKGDIRKTLLQLQYWVQSGGQLTEVKMPVKIEHQAEIVYEKLFEDEQFEPLTDVKQKINEHIRVHQNCFRSFEIFEHHEPFSIPYYLNLGFLWWNIPNIFGMTNFSNKRIDRLKLAENLQETKQKKGTENKPKDIEKIKLRHISNFYDSLTFADVTFRKYNYFDGLEPQIKNHTSIMRDSLELEENFNSHKDLEFMHELTHTLVNGYIKLFNCDGSNEVKLNVGVPHKSEFRWRTKHHVCEDLFRESLSPCTYVERKSTYLDYYPLLRSISRSEIHRAANNTKRGNRFRNYLRDLGIKCSENNVKIACKMLWYLD